MNTTLKPKRCMPLSFDGSCVVPCMVCQEIYEACCYAGMSLLWKRGRRNGGACVGGRWGEGWGVDWGQLWEGVQSGC